VNPELWGTVKRVFEEAADLLPEDQAEFVRSRSDGDGEVEAEVLRLLGAHSSSAAFLEVPAADLHTYLGPQADEPSLPVGMVVAKRFEILRFLNRGGMGEVYEAWDAELKERIALKTIRAGIASRMEVIERFKREVKHAREISHPNICRVHELFSDEVRPGHRMWFLSMELLLGPTLLDLIRTDGPLKTPLAMSVTRQMVSGLSAAHALGLVHRDFKSSNVILLQGATSQTRAVITDFGLALRVLEPADGITEPGGMGTPGYIAPEQERHGEVGPLADQYSLGAVLCEMLTGSLPRWSKPERATQKETLDLPEHRFPPRWEAVIQRCLQRDPKDRFPTIESVSRALAPPGLLGTPWRIAAALVLLTLLAGGGLFWLRVKDRCRICDVVQLTPDTDESESPSLSRDGHAIAYSSDRADSGNLDIFLQKLPAGQPVRLTRDPARDRDPSISPDGNVIAFRSERDGGGIYLTDAQGTAARLLVPRGRNPQISPDGATVVYWTGDRDPGVASGKIFLLPLQGGEPIEIARDFPNARFPIWSPDGRALLFSGCKTAAETLPACLEWWIASSDGSRIVDTGVLERLSADGSTQSRPRIGFWYSQGLVFSDARNGRHENLWRIRLNPRTWKAVGGPEPLLQGDARDLAPSFASQGAIAYTRISGSLHVWRIDHASHPDRMIQEKITDDAQIDGTPFISEGGRWLVFGRGRGAQKSIWRRDNLTSMEAPLQSTGKLTQSPVIDKTGDLLAYEQVETEGRAIYIKVGGGAAKQLCRGCSLPTGWFDSHRALFYRDGVPSVIKMADPRTGADRVLLRKDGASLSEANWSPANELMLFTETIGDRKRIFAVHVPRSSGRAEGKWISIPDPGVSPDHPRWSGDGRTVFYLSDSDGFSCIYGQVFWPEGGRVVGKPFAVAHFHNQRSRIDSVFAEAVNLSVDGDSIYFNRGEQSSTVWIGTLASR